MQTKRYKKRFMGRGTISMIRKIKREKAAKDLIRKVLIKEEKEGRHRTRHRTRRRHRNRTQEKLDSYENYKKLKHEIDKQEAVEQNKKLLSYEKRKKIEKDWRDYWWKTPEKRGWLRPGFW
jgi:hypothetical protein